MIKLNIACGPNIFPYDGWINYDREDVGTYIDALLNNPLINMPPHQADLKNYLLSGATVDFRVHDLNKQFNHDHDTVDLIYIGQAIEHLNRIYEAPSFLNECHRMMKEGGILRMTTPDLDLLIQTYLSGRMSDFNQDQPLFYQDLEPSGQLAMLMFGAVGPKCTFNNYEGHFFLYTEASMRQMLEKLGFRDISFYREPGISSSDILAKECVDAGLSHSFIVECKK